jgi:toxin ParE1/3/4
MRKLGVRFSPIARRELGEISVYRRKEANTYTARQQIERINNAIDRLRDFPDMGVLSHSYVGHGRRWFVSSYVILYMSDAKVLSILHVLHKSQDRGVFFESQ